MNDLNDLNDIAWCFKRKNENNIQLFINLVPSKATNNINMACINLLLNNNETTKALLNLNNERLLGIAKAIPSQLKTLLCLENFNLRLNNSLKMNPSCQKQIDFLISLEYSEMSSFINSVKLVPALNNESLKQMTFEF